MKKNSAKTSRNPHNHNHKSEITVKHHKPKSNPEEEERMSWPIPPTFPDNDKSDLISQTKDLCVLEQIAAVNCSAFAFTADGSLLPSDLVSRQPQILRSLQNRNRARKMESPLDEETRLKLEAEAGGLAGKWCWKSTTKYDPVSSPADYFDSSRSRRRSHHGPRP